MASTAIQIQGLNKTVRSLEKFGVETTDLKAVFKRIGTSIATDAKSNVRTQTGRLAASIRAANAKNKAVIRAGGAKVVYAGVQEYGGYNNITAMEYMRKAADDGTSTALRLMDDGIRDLIRKYGL